MTDTVIWLHEKALGLTHPVMQDAHKAAKIIHIWDDGYYRAQGYSLKRLVFIYETLCALKIDIIHGDSLAVFRALSPQKIIVPYTVASGITTLYHQLAGEFDCRLIKDVPFAQIAPEDKFRRFFKYWQKAKATAFLRDAGAGDVA